MSYGILLRGTALALPILLLAACSNATTRGEATIRKQEASGSTSPPDRMPLLSERPRLSLFKWRKDGCDMGPHTLSSKWL